MHWGINQNRRQECDRIERDAILEVNVIWDVALINAYFFSNDGMDSWATSS
jgi:hypothetical protein